MSETVSVVRTEKKYRIDWSQRNILMNKLSNVMEMDSSSDKNGYMVRSVYFDSIYDDDYFDKVDGLEFRKKIRLRIYSTKSSMVKLEMKQKQGAAQRKSSMLISRKLAEEMLDGCYSGLLEIATPLSQEIYQILERGVYRPKCVIEYHRTAFVETCNNIRITFDSEICASTSCKDFFEEDLFLIPILNSPVLEVKYNGFLLSNIKNIVDMANTSEIAVSKYALSRQMMY